MAFLVSNRSRNGRQQNRASELPYRFPDETRGKQGYRNELIELY